jgi:hypothetical protein
MWFEGWDSKRLLAGVLFTAVGATWTGVRAWHSRTVAVDDTEDQVGLSLLLIGALLIAEGVGSLAP